MDQQQARLWLAIALSMLVWFAYDHYVLAPTRPHPADQTAVVDRGGGELPVPEVEKKAEAVAVSDVPVAPDGKDAFRQKPSGREIIVDTPLVRAAITPAGGRFTSFRLKSYRTRVDRESPELELVAQDEGAILPLTMWVGSRGADTRVEYAAEQTTFVVGEGETKEITLRGEDSSGNSFSKTLTFDGSSYLVGVELRTGEQETADSVGLIIPKISQTGGYSQDGDHAVAIVDDRLVEHSATSMAETSSKSEGVSWAGFTGAYFAAVAVPLDPRASALFGAIESDPIVRVDVGTQGNGAASFEVFMGPKDLDVLRSYGKKLDRLIDYGWFWFIASPMLWLLHRTYDVVSNYGIAIIIVTVLLKAVTFPLNQVSMKSMRKMQEIQPLMQRLKERHKDDPAAMQREMMEIYKKHNVNPFSGCLPMLVQIPIFIGLYNGLMRDIALRHAPFVGWINDLSAPDRLHVAGVGVPVLTLLMGASMLLQQVTAPAQGDPTQRRMMMIMPVVFTFMFVNFPSGLVLYWLVNNVISIGQQYLAMRST